MRTTCVCSVHATRHTNRCMQPSEPLDTCLSAHRSVHAVWRIPLDALHMYIPIREYEQNSQRALCGVRRDACRTTLCSERADSTPPGACHTAQTYNTLMMHTTRRIAWHIGASRSRHTHRPVHWTRVVKKKVYASRRAMPCATCTCTS